MHRTCVFANILGFTSTLVRADNWPSWRGPSANGVAPSIATCGTLLKKKDEPLASFHSTQRRMPRPLTQSESSCVRLCISWLGLSHVCSGSRGKNPAAPAGDHLVRCTSSCGE